MATTVNQDMVIYDRLAQTAYLERIQDVIEVFNANSNGAMILRSEAIEGDFDKAAFYKVGGVIEHRDVNSTAAVDGKKIGADEMVSVKVPWKYGPYETTEEAFKRRTRSPEEFYMLLGQDLADAYLAGAIEHCFVSLDAAIGTGPMAVNGDIAVDGKKVLTRGMRAFGDRFQRISLLAMDSATYFDIVDDAIGTSLFGEANVVVYGGMPGTMGKPVLVSDRIPEKTIYGLQAGAIQVVESQAPGFRSYDINLQENMALGYRAEGAFNMSLLGYSWGDSAPANPTLALLGSTANWRKHASDNKNTAAVKIKLT